MLDHRVARPVARPVARIERLQVVFRTRGGPVVAVEDVSFSVAPGETVCVVGESGSGKSALALALMRLVEFEGGRITRGRVLFDRGESKRIDLVRTDPAVMRRIRGDRIGMVFQEPMTALNPVLTIGRQLTEGLRLHRGLSRRAAQARALELLREVRLPDPERRLRQYPHELSGGMRQRVVIAMAVACRPRLLIADEPTTALDVTVQAGILGLFNRLRREVGCAMVLITHDMGVVAQMADRVVVMHRGRKVEEGDVREIFEAPRHPHTRALLAAVPRLGEMRGRPAPAPMPLAGAERPPAAVTGGEGGLLDIRNLVVRFPVRGGWLRRTVGQLHAVEDVSLTLGRGRTLGLVGETGCGKSTLGRAILRLVEPLAGEIRLGATDIRALGPRALRQARRRMQMIFQDPLASLDPQIPIAEQIAEPLRNFGIGTRAERAERVAALLDRVHLSRALMRRYPHELSGGQRQRVAIARALALGPELIVADEALSALDASVQARVLNLMLELQADLGLSFLFISHDMAVVERVSHDVAVMYMGRIVETGPRAAVLEDPRHPYTRALLRAVPVADPRQRRLEGELGAGPVPSPIRPPGWEPEPPRYEELGGGHRVLVSEWRA